MGAGRGGVTGMGNKQTRCGLSASLGLGGVGWGQWHKGARPQSGPKARGLWEGVISKAGGNRSNLKARIRWGKGRWEVPNVNLICLSVPVCLPELGLGSHKPGSCQQWWSLVKLPVAGWGQA